MHDQSNRRLGPAPALGDMSAEDFRRAGHQIIDWLSEYLNQPAQHPVFPDIRPGEFKSRLPSAPPAQGEPFEDILADVERLVPPALTHWNHPCFFAYFATSASAPGIFGEILSAAFNVNAMLWRTSPAATELEEVALSWLRQMMRLPPDFDGIIYDTASISSMHALVAAREHLNLRIRDEGMSGRPDLGLMRLYASEQAHSSIEKALLTVGLGQRSLRKVETDQEFRMVPEALHSAIRKDFADGMIPFCVVATVGTTSTTSIDPVAQIADVCATHNLWLHVDAAYAGSASLLPELRSMFQGCERAHSFVTNPHKWLFTPLDLSVLFCRRMDVLKRAFSLVPEYLKSQQTETARDGMDYGVQLGRRFRALKLWMIMRYFGQEGLASRIREHCRLAGLFASWVSASEVWDLKAPVPLSSVCFRATPPRSEQESDDGYLKRLDTLNEEIMVRSNATGKIFISHTRLHGAFVLRLAIGNIRTAEEHVRLAWRVLNEQLHTLIGTQPE